MSSRQPTSDRLRDYRAKRDFSTTPEPAGIPAGKRPRKRGTRSEKEPRGPRRFVVQRHRARRLHYDLRLEIDGTLASWAVPKGPTLDPAAKRLAMHVEDHPLEYFDFEGVIPDGEYGAGDVIVWDWGNWEAAPGSPEPSVAAVHEGDLHFVLRGEKLQGRFALVRRGRRGDQWLLIHKKDEYAEPGWDPEEHATSVLSGLTNEEVAARPEGS